MNLSWSLKSQTHCLLVIVKSQKTLERSNSGKDLYFLNANIGVRWRPKFQKVSPGQINQYHLPGCWISLRRKYPGATLIICVNMPLFVNAIENVSHTIMEGVKLDPGCIVPAAEGRGQVWVVFFVASSYLNLNRVSCSSEAFLFDIHRYTCCNVLVHKMFSDRLLKKKEEERLLSVSWVFFFTTSQCHLGK